MKILRQQNSTVSKLLTAQACSDDEKRYAGFVIKARTDDGLLLFNTLTGEILLLEGGEFPQDVLYEKYFLVPSGFSDRKLADEVRTVAKIIVNSRSKGISSYTVLTTTDCNARCFYCYENGCEKITMSDDTARDVADYIIRNASEGKAKISWFGGEPLVNSRAIDIICKKAAEAGLEFSSSMISNGYLFDEENVRRAKEKWNLRQVQITLDGTAGIYEKRKAYSGSPAHPFDTVTENMKRLLDAGINVRTRLNMDDENAADLFELSDFLSGHFGSYTKDRSPVKGSFSVYCHLLFDLIEKLDKEAQEKLADRYFELCSHIRESNLASPGGLSDGVVLVNCMADSPSSVVILPDGRLHSCEHFPGSRIWGSVYTGETKNTKGDGGITPLEYWAEKPSYEACGTCALYAVCTKLTHCPDTKGPCTEFYRQDRYMKIRESLLSFYENYKKRHFTMHIADRFFEVEARYDTVKQICEKYISEDNGSAERIKITSDMIKNEQKYTEGGEVTPYSSLESAALFRAVTESLIGSGTFLVHGSAVMADGNVYLFSGVSGAGKSTHAALWRKLLGSRAVMINDDKPYLREEHDGIYVYGSPWNGQHHLDTDTKGKLRAVCFISQAEENSIEKIPFRTALPLLMRQIYRPEDPEKLSKTLVFIEKLSEKIDFYSLYCNMDIESAKLSYEKMRN